MGVISATSLFLWVQAEQPRRQEQQFTMLLNRNMSSSCSIAFFFFFGKAVASGRPWLFAAWDTTRNKCSCHLQRQVTSNQNRSAPGRAEAPLSNQSKMDFYLCVGPFIGGLLISSQFRAMNIPLWDKQYCKSQLVFSRGEDFLIVCFLAEVLMWGSWMPLPLELSIQQAVRKSAGSLPHTTAKIKCWMLSIRPLQKDSEPLGSEPCFPKHKYCPG